MWDKIKKVNGNKKHRIIPLLEGGGNTLTLPDKIVETFADHFANILRGAHKKIEPGKHRKGKGEKMPKRC